MLGQPQMFCFWVLRRTPGSFAETLYSGKEAGALDVVGRVFKVPGLTQHLWFKNCLWAWCREAGEIAAGRTITTVFHVESVVTSGTSCYCKIATLNVSVFILQFSFETKRPVESACKYLFVVGVAR